MGDLRTALYEKNKRIDELNKRVDKQNQYIAKQNNRIAELEILTCELYKLIKSRYSSGEIAKINERLKRLGVVR